MLVKIRPNIFINTDNVISVDLEHRPALVLAIGENNLFPVSQEAAIYLLSQMDASAAVMLPGEPDYIDPSAPERQPLTSRVAVLLRDTFPQGATIDQLVDVLHLDYHLIYSALNSLTDERVTQVDITGLYFHASHFPKEYAPEHEVGFEVDLLDITPFQSALRDGEFQCAECKVRSCATCVTANACCKCNCPNFSFRKPNPIDSHKALLAYLLKQSENALAETISFLHALKAHDYDCKHLRQLESLLQAIRLVTPNPDLSTVTEAPGLNLGEDTGLIVGRTSER